MRVVRSVVCIEPITWWQLQWKLTKLLLLFFGIDLIGRISIAIIVGSTHSWWDDQWVSLSDWMFASGCGYLSRGWIDAWRD